MAEIEEELAATVATHEVAEGKLAGDLDRVRAERDERAAAAGEAERRLAEATAAIETRIKAMERAAATAAEARERAERDLTARVAQAEARLADAARRQSQALQERKEADARALRALAEAQARFQEELQQRDTMRAQEAQRLQAALQERSRQVRVLELEVQRTRTSNVARAIPVPAAGPEEGVTLAGRPPVPRTDG